MCQRILAEYNKMNKNYNNNFCEFTIVTCYLKGIKYVGQPYDMRYPMPSIKVFLMAGWSIV